MRYEPRKMEIQARRLRSVQKGSRYYKISFGTATVRSRGSRSAQREERYSPGINLGANTIC